MRNRKNRHRVHHFKNRKAIANIVTSAIMLSAVSIMGAVMFGWSQTTMATQQQELEDIYNIQLNRINEDLLFENVWFPTSPANHLNVTITNVGSNGMNVTSIWVTNVTGTNNTQFEYDYSTGGILPSESFSALPGYEWDTNDELQITVFSERENQYVTQVVAP